MGKGEDFTHKNKGRRKTSNVELMKKATRTTIDRDNIKKRRQRKSIYSSSNVQLKRMNIACASCKQKYPMIVPFEGWKNFVCSRCKKNNARRSNVCRKHLNVVIASTNVTRSNLDRQASGDLRGKTRVISMPRNPSQSSRKDISADNSKYQFDKRPMRSSSLYLTKRISSTQGSELSYSCEICGKSNIRTRDSLDKHMRTHTGQSLYHCDVCTRVFKDRSAFQMHYLTHEK